MPLAKCLVMTRILSIGSELDFANSIDWHQEKNYKDYNIIFMNLRDLENRSEEFIHPYYDSNDRAVNFPTRKEILSFVQKGGNDLIIALPSSSSIELRGGKQRNVVRKASPAGNSTDQGTDQEQHGDDGNQENDEEEPSYYSCNLFAWLPAGVNIEDRGGESVVSLDGTDVGSRWDWYFDGDFGWDLTFQYVYQRAWMTERSTYRNPTSGVSSSRGPDEKHGPFPRMQEIAVNASNECIAAKIELFPRKETDKSKLDQYPSPQGGIYLVPLKPSIPFADFAREVLVENYDVLERGLEHQPDWVQDYALPTEQQLQERISELKDELNELKEKIEEPAAYKPLLYDVGNPLEEIVRETLRDVGLEVEGEVPGKRDGTIKLDDKWIVLEIYGSTSGVSARKYRQLTDWVENVKIEHPDKNVEGLLIANPFSEEEPDERSSDLLTGDVKRLMEQRGFHAIRTIDIYRMISGYRNDEFTTSEIESRFANMTDLVLDFEDVESSPI